MAASGTWKTPKPSSGIFTPFDNVTQHLIRTTNFLATISTLSMDLRNDGTHRRLISLVDPELEVLYYISYLKSNREKVKAFLQWAGAQKGAE